MGIIIAELTRGGYLYKTSSNWSTLRNSTTATFVDLNPPETKAGAAYDGISSYELTRTYISFDTSPLIGSSITSLTLNLHWTDFPDGGKMVGLASPKPLGTVLDVTHYDITTFGNYYFDSATTATFSSISLSNDAINDAVTNGELNIVILEHSKDYSNGTFTLGEQLGKYIKYNTIGEYPYLEYTMNNKVNGTNNYSRINDITYTSIGKINNIIL